MPRRNLATTVAHLLVPCLLLALALPAQASAGDYTVRITSMAGSWWTTYGGVPFITTPQRVYSGIGHFEAGDYKSWRMVVPGEGAQIVGGRIVTTEAMPDAAMHGRILVGNGNSPVTLYDGHGTGTVERSITSGAYDWIQFDLRATTAVRTTAVGTNWTNLSYADLVLRDTVPPVVTALSLPAPTTWYGSGACIPFSIRASDQGGGLARVTVRRVATGALVTDWTAPLAAAPKPGPNEQQLDDCIQPAERGHGDTQFVATVWDVSGVSRELSFQVRADQVAPTIGGGPGEGARFTTDRPSIGFEVGDEGAGVAAVSATLDGAPVPVTVTGSTAHVEVGQLRLGSHSVAIGVSDGAGNGSRAERRFSVGDVAPPVLALSSPGARGEATVAVTLKVSASDDVSGVDPTTWKVTVDDAPVPFDGAVDGVAAGLGQLQPGTHGIAVSVADRSGNLATLSHSYYVIPPPPPPAPEPIAAEAPGRSGLVLVDGPRSPVGFGQRTAVSINVTRLGRPVGNQLVEVRREGHAVGSGVTDDAGIARVAFAVGAPGSYAATAVGLALDPLETGVKVAPRLVITTSRSSLGSDSAWSFLVGSSRRSGVGASLSRRGSGACGSPFGERHRRMQPVRSVRR